MEFVLNDYHRNISDDDLIEDVKRVAEKLGTQKLSSTDYKKFGKYGINTFNRHFGGWNKTLELCGLEPSIYQVSASKSSHNHQSVNTEELIADIQRVAEELGAQTISSGDYMKYGSYSKDTCLRRFSTWNEALVASGLTPYEKVAGKRLNDEDLLIEIERMWIALGRQPTTTDIVNGLSEYSLNTFTRHFGGWRGALKSFVEWINSEKSDHIIPEKSTKPKSVPRKLNKPHEEKHEAIKHKTSREISLRLRFLVMKRDNFKCCICGRSPANDPSVELHIDHIIPWSKGGETTFDNLRTLCSKCNLGKSDFTE